MPNVYSIYVDIYSIDDGSHVVGDARQEVTCSSDARADHRYCLINSMLNVLLNLQKRVSALAYFWYYIALHEHRDVVQRESNIWQLKSTISEHAFDRY